MRLRSRGTTLMEMIATLAVAAVVGAIALPVTNSFVDRARNNRAVGDIGVASLQLHRWQQKNGTFPDSLAEAGIDMPKDPWGRTYVYARNGARRAQGTGRDIALAAVNSDFDLYSLGRDGKTSPEARSLSSLDDIVRANNGAYIGPAGNLIQANASD